MENRYEKYKDSGIAWIGEIPEHWDVCKLSTLFFQHKQKNSGSQEINLLSLSYGNILIPWKDYYQNHLKIIIL